LPATRDKVNRKILLVCENQYFVCLAAVPSRNKQAWLSVDLLLNGSPPMPVIAASPVVSKNSIRFFKPEPAQNQF